VARGWVGLSGYRIALLGEAEVGRTLRVAKLFGLPALAAAAEGQAQIDLQIAGTWHGWMEGTRAGFSNLPQPQVTGTAKLHSVRVEVRGVEDPIEISSANLQLLPDKVRVTKLTANAAHALWMGTLELPRGCGTPGACTITFDLTTSQLNLSEAAQWVSPRAQPRSWYRLSANEHTGPTFFTSLHAEGSVTANRLVLRGVAANQLSANHVSADVSLDAGKLKLSDLRGEFLGGKHRGEWRADFSVRPAVYTGSGTVTEIALRQLAGAMHDEWIAGTASGSYQMTASSAASSDFWNSAEGIVQFDVRDGMLPHLLLVDGGDPLKVERLQGRAHLQDGKIEIKEARLDSPSGKFQVSGAASLTRELDLKFTTRPDATAGAKTYAVGGTLAEPHVTQVSTPETQAQLK
jgi:hypothetical protein